ncbi:Late competence protein ComGE [Streptococcus sp. DD10]|uniref:competence type IV pilus minor pilin ComGE n=1 Tax=Streptococcus sp. DD10 TaxID=1777878 RepID=UPI00079BB9C4|nr:competence type IV pilus minor pilin ComGE [Streptococcus sp. DD10]KXT74463.1 Late competence protein ComGE [Streptococcus sp. DD10]
MKVKGYILLESLVALGIFSIVVTLFLGQINQARREERRILREEEVLRVAQMALQTRQSSLSLNGVTVEVQRTERAVQVFENGRELVHVVKN